MASALLGRMLQRSLGAASCHRMAPSPRAIISRFPGMWAPVRLLSSRAAAKPVEVEAEPFDDDDGEMDWMDSQTASVRRRVLKLKEAQESYDTSNREYQKELATLQAKYLAIYQPVFDLRRDVVLGKAPVEDYKIEDDGEADKGIPEFWLTAFYNHEKRHAITQIGPYITERDAEVLKHLIDIRASVLTEEERGFELTFFFEENKFFSNKTLTKRYILEPEDDIIPKEFTGCEIKWKDSSLNPTVEQKKRRVKSKEAGKGGKPAFVVEEEPCESFFNIFEPPKIPTTPEELDANELDALQEELSADFEIGFAIKDQILPRAVEWFTGELSQFDEGDEYDEFEGEQEFDEPEPEPQPKFSKRR